MMPNREPTRELQTGAALVVALVFLLVMTVLGVTSMSTTTLQERMAGNFRDNHLAFQAAEAALREGEALLQQASLPPFDGTAGLLPTQDGAGRRDYWSNDYDWDASSRTATTFQGIEQAPASPPRYVIEELPPLPAAGGSVRFGALPEAGFYRITARGVGGTEEAVSILQSTYRR